MRKHIRKYLPDHDKIRDNRWLAIFGDALRHPRLWHLNRHSAAGAVAIGLFCGLIPGPFQMLIAALVCIACRVNLPLALVTTLYTNPLTIVPLYLVAFGLGELVTGTSGGQFVGPPEWQSQGLVTWAGQIADWMVRLGRPLFVGLALLATLLAVAGYALVRGAWRWYLVRAWRRRSLRA